MDEDKACAYATLFMILENYVQYTASFAPFISEYIYLALQEFKGQDARGESVHLQHLPMSHKHYINQTLLNEVSLVRRIISLGLFVRSKNKIAVKQPLSTMEVKM